MTVIRLAAAAVLCGLMLFAAPARVGAQGPAGAPSATPADAAAWGLYTQLAGAARQAAAGGYRIQWRWAQPGTELVEEYFTPQGKLVHSATITPGAAPGSLLMRGSSLGGKQWNGTVQPDGSVVYVGSGLLKMHFKAMLGADGAYEVRTVKLRDGAVASVGEPTTSNRYLPVEATQAAVATGVAEPAAPATAVPSAPTSISAPAHTQVPAAPAAAAAVAPTPATPVQAAPASFGAFDAYVGRSLVGNSSYGTAFTLDVRREGNDLVLQRAFPNGVQYGRIVLRATPVPGAFELLQVWDAKAGGNRSAHVAGSPGAPPVSPLDGYYADPREPGSLVLEYDVSGGYVVLVLRPTGSGGLEYYQHGGNRRFGIRGAIGASDYVAVGWFTPASDAAVANSLAYAQAESAREAERRAEDARDRAEAQDRAQAAAYNSLLQATEAATASEARSRAALEATLDQAARQAAYERQQPSAAAWSAQDVDNARAATERQHEIARQFEARQQAQRQAQAAAATQARAAASPAERPAAGPASTRERADGCVGQPMTSTHQCGSGRAGLKGRVVNSCAAAVDVRMCFMTATGWSCQSEYGIDPEDAWEPGDCGATGQVFRAVRYSDSSEPLASP